MIAFFDINPAANPVVRQTYTCPTCEGRGVMYGPRHEIWVWDKAFEEYTPIAPRCKTCEGRGHVYQHDVEPCPNCSDNPDPDCWVCVGTGYALHSAADLWAREQMQNDLSDEYFDLVSSAIQF